MELTDDQKLRLDAICDSIAELNERLDSHGARGDASLLETIGGWFGQPKTVQRKDPAVLAALAKAPVYKKQGQVQARPLKPGEVITTKLASGQVETKNASGKKGDWIVRNPGGEEYVVPAANFKQKYQKTADPNTFRAKGTVRAIENPHGRPIRQKAEWGETQSGGRNAILAQSVDHRGKPTSDPYIIERKAFNQTYAPRAKKTGSMPPNSAHIEYLRRVAKAHGSRQMDAIADALEQIQSRMDDYENRP